MSKTILTWSLYGRIDATLMVLMELNHASIGVSKQRSYPNFHEIGYFDQPDIAGLEAAA
jgi:hypothetical protein